MRALAAIVLAALAALRAAPALAQSPEPSSSPTASATPEALATATPWRLHLPQVLRPAKELTLLPGPRLGGAAMGIATNGRVLLQAQGAGLHHWVAEGGEGGGMDYRGQALDLLDPAPVEDAWLTLEGRLATYLRQLREPVPGEAGRSRAFMRLSLLPVENEGVSSAGGNLDLPGRLTAHARAGGRLYMAMDDPEGPGRWLLTVDVSAWEAPRPLDRQDLSETAAALLALPETAQLLALGRGSAGPELWAWDLRGPAPRPQAATPLPLSGEPVVLLRIPEGLLLLDRGGKGLVIPLSKGRLRPDRSRSVAFPLDQVAGPDGRRFVDVDAAVWAAGQVCLYHGIHVSTHAATRAANNLLACFNLPGQGPPVLGRVVAADPLIDVSWWGPRVHLAALGHLVLLARGSAGGIEVVSLNQPDPSLWAQTVDTGAPGKTTALLRQGARLFSAEAGAQLRAWTLADAEFIGLRQDQRLALPGAGRLITRDLPGLAASAALEPRGPMASAARGSIPSIVRRWSGSDRPTTDRRRDQTAPPAVQLVLWREGGLAIAGRLQRVRLLDGEGPPSAPSFEPLPPELVPDWDASFRAAGRLLWSRQSGSLWRLGDGGREPLKLPGLRAGLQDVALLGEFSLLAAGADGLMVLDGADQVVAHLGLPDAATAIAVDAARGGAAVWVAGGGRPDLPPEPRGSAALHCIDLSDPLRPRLRATIDLPGDRIDRLRAAGGGSPAAPGARLAGSGWQRRSTGGVAYDDPLFFIVDAQDCEHPRLLGATRPDRPPPFLRRPYEEARLDWDLGPDGRSLFAAQGGLARYGWIDALGEAR